MQLSKTEDIKNKTIAGTLSVSIFVLLLLFLFARCVILIIIVGYIAH